MPPSAVSGRALGDGGILQRVNRAFSIIAASNRCDRVFILSWAGVVELAILGHGTEQPAKGLAGGVEVAAFKVDLKIEPPREVYYSWSNCAFVAIFYTPRSIRNGLVNSCCVVRRAIALAYRGLWVTMKAGLRDALAMPSCLNRFLYDCKWYDNIGPGPQDDEMFCRSGCPSDRIRVAMDQYYNMPEGNYACHQGVEAKCCIPKSSAITKRETSKDSLMRDELEAFIEYPVCDSSTGFGDFSLSARSVNESESETEPDRAAHHHPHHPHGHVRGFFSKRRHCHHSHLHDASTPELRQTGSGSFQQDEVTGLLVLLLMSKAATNQEGIWDDIVPQRYPNLECASLAAYVEKTQQIIR
ncbi:hypothetical protein EDB81DRAFT_947739 [Dactylonectria macrodidyma]|uniref:Uncharacterized protein n=1 Tax=Dactylonectria macrodidyma TaxID=307937 RepID=A0A9P9J5Q1_9HYPO|nr:hypothetical protein EDB81DRAFT_947739 [Dactylonectria macrodidyma]